MTVEAPPKKKNKARSFQNESDIVDAVRELLGLDPLYGSKNKTSISRHHQQMIANPYLKQK